VRPAPLSAPSDRAARRALPLARRQAGCSEVRFGGFTLVEVMVALTIVAITLAAGFRAAQALALGAQRAQDASEARWCADNHLTQIKLYRQFPDLGGSEFSCTQMGRAFSGEMQVKSTPNPNFRRVDIQVRSPDGAPVLRISTIVPRL
jgi:general secretion pathway protein I